MANGTRWQIAERSVEPGPVVRSGESNKNNLAVMRNISVVIKRMVDKLADSTRRYRSLFDDRCMDRETVT